MNVIQASVDIHVRFHVIDSLDNGKDKNLFAHPHIIQKDMLANTNSLILLIKMTNSELFRDYY